MMEPRVSAVLRPFAARVALPLRTMIVSGPLPVFPRYCVPDSRLMLLN